MLQSTADLKKNGNEYDNFNSEQTESQFLDPSMIQNVSSSDEVPLNNNGDECHQSGKTVEGYHLKQQEQVPNNVVYFGNQHNYQYQQPGSSVDKNYAYQNLQTQLNNNFSNYGNRTATSPLGQGPSVFYPRAFYESSYINPVKPPYIVTDPAAYGKDNQVFSQSVAVEQQQQQQQNLGQQQPRMPLPYYGNTLQFISSPFLKTKREFIQTTDRAGFNCW